MTWRAMNEAETKQLLADMDQDQFTADCAAMIEIGHAQAILFDNGNRSICFTDLGVAAQLRRDGRLQ